MTNPPLKVDNLLKIFISVEAGTSPEHMDLTASGQPVEFIFGIGAHGITPFEYRLAGKACGDRTTLRVQRSDAPSFFEHLAFPILRHVPRADTFFLTVTVVDVVRPDSRDIIRAMAEKTGCGDGCDCGCGCGH